MKKAHSHPLAKIFHATLAFAILLPHAFAADDSPSIATSTLNGLNSALGNVNGFMSAFGSSNLQMQQLAQQLMGAQNQTQGAQTQQSQFDQINQQLAMAMTEAQNCVQKATRNYDKFYAKHKNAANVSTDTITAAEPTCKNYGTLLDAIATNKARMEDSNKKMACLMNLQNTIGQIAEKAKAPFTALNNQAKEVYQTHSQIIDAHKKMAEKIDMEVNGKDGKGGYRERLGKLKQMALDLNNVLNAKQGEGKDGLKNGLVKQIENLKQARSWAANNWYKTMINDVEACYHNTPTTCFENDVMMSPDQCIPAMIQNQTAGLQGSARKVIGKEDLAGLNRINIKGYVRAGKTNIPANIDVTQPDEFLQFTGVRFEETLSGVIAAYRSHTFNLPIDKAKLMKYVSDNYKACYDKAVTEFKADMISKGAGGKYYGEIQGVKDAERETANDIKNWIDRVEGEMSEFRTAFHKVYNSELGQFKTDCTAEEDPYKSLDCLRVLNATLNSGIRGTRQATKLSNGSTYVSTAGETSLPMQTLTLDAAGKPTVGTSNASCSGFDDCINLMDRTQEQHLTAQAKGEEDRVKFVQQHNAAVRSSFELISGQFAQMNQLLMAGVKGVNDDLTKIGIKTVLKTKEIEGETLEEDGKVGEEGHTGMIKLPKSMKAAMAGQKGMSEIDNLKDVTDAYNSLGSELNKKATEAQKMKQKCTISKSEYSALADIMPKNCGDAKSVCSVRDRAAGGVAQLELIFRKSKNVLADDEKLSTNSEYNRCKSEILATGREVTSADIIKAVPGGREGLYDKDGKRKDSAYDEAKETAVADKAERARKQAKAECGDVIFPPLTALAGQGRGALAEQNTNLVKYLRDVSDACANMDSGPEADNSDVTEACEAFKSAAKKAEPPKDEEETKADDVKGNEPSTNPLTMPGIGIPAK